MVSYFFIEKKTVRYNQQQTESGSQKITTPTELAAYNYDTNKQCYT